MSDDLIGEEVLHQKIDKIRVSSAEIVVHGTKEKPYYEIKYFDLSDNEMHIGYSSYNLDFVFGYLEKYFEIVGENGEHGKSENPITGDLISRKDLVGTERLLMTDIVENNKVARYILEQVLYDIEHAPVAFDKEKVIEELNNFKNSKIDMSDDEPELADVDSIYEEGLSQGEINAYIKAIEIVEKGGVSY